MAAWSRCLHSHIDLGLGSTWYLQCAGSPRVWLGCHSRARLPQDTRVAAVVDQLAAGPRLVERRRVEATLEHALGGVGQQHQATEVRGGRCSCSSWASHAGLKSCASSTMTTSKRVGDRRPVAVQVTDGDGVPPLAVGVVGHVEWRHAVERPGDAVERPDGEPVVGRQPVDEDRRRAGRCSRSAGRARPRPTARRAHAAASRVLPLPAPPVTSTRRFASSGSSARTRCSHSSSIRCRARRARAASSQSSSQFGRSTRTTAATPSAAELLAAPPQAHQPVDGVGRVVEERARHELRGLELRREVAAPVGRVREHDAVLHPAARRAPAPPPRSQSRNA